MHRENRVTSAVCVSGACGVQQQHLGVRVGIDRR